MPRGHSVASQRLRVAKRRALHARRRKSHCGARDTVLSTLAATLRSAAGRSDRGYSASGSVPRRENRRRTVAGQRPTGADQGANRHEMDPDYGYYVSEEERMLQDIRIMKNNINADAYLPLPDDARWYSLCDEYGIYVVAGNI